MFFSNYLIFIYIVIFVAIYNVAKLVSKRVLLKNGVILIGNLLILLTLVKEHTLIVLAIVSLAVYLIGILLNRRNSKLLLSASLFFTIALFSIRNYPYVQELLESTWLSIANKPILSVQKIGLSYILFRYVHWLIESYKSTIKDANFITFLNYIFFFPSILAGPIDTYNNFQYWLQSSRLNYHRELFFAGVTRIVIGATKTLLIVPLVIGAATDYTSLLPNHSPLVAIFLSLLAYSAYIYMDFSGYSDIAIGTAYMIGIKTPENFNNPYISLSLSEFWKRWHITFSLFLKLYVFKPILHLFNNIFNPKYRLFVSILCYITTFLICGVWHGDSINFVYWGAWHGVGLAINKIWMVKIKPVFGLKDTRIYKGVSMMVTFIYVTIGWVFFHYSSEQLGELFKLIL